MNAKVLENNSEEANSKITELLQPVLEYLNTLEPDTGSVAFYIKDGNTYKSTLIRISITERAAKYGANLPKVLVYSDESFGEDDVKDIPDSEYSLAYYLPYEGNHPVYGTDSPEVDKSEFQIDAEEYDSYKDEPELFMEHYGHDLTKMKPMLYRHQ